MKLEEGVPEEDGGLDEDCEGIVGTEEGLGELTGGCFEREEGVEVKPGVDSIKSGISLIKSDAVATPGQGAVLETCSPAGGLLLGDELELQLTQYPTIKTIKIVATIGLNNNFIFTVSNTPHHTIISNSLF